jgi:dethiobiotin synthetase
MSAVFITGTGTAVGKTFVTAALIRILRERGRQVDALKPVASGFDPACIGTSDPGILLAALQRATTTEALERMTPWRYAAPRSPDMAARMAGQRLDFEALVAFTRRAVAAAPDALLIEGVGGVMVPLDERHTVLDWIEELELPVLLVGGSYLGGLSHALTALDVLARRHLRVIAMIVSETPNGVDLPATVETIARFSPGIPVLGLPLLPSAESTHDVLHRVTDLF